MIKFNDAKIGDKVNVTSRNQYACVSNVELRGVMDDVVFAKFSNNCIYEIPNVTEIRKVEADERPAFCNHRDDKGYLTIEYDDTYEMRASDMHCKQCGASGSRAEFESGEV